MKKVTLNIVKNLAFFLNINNFSFARHNNLKMYSHSQFNNQFQYNSLSSVNESSYSNDTQNNSHMYYDNQSYFQPQSHYYQPNININLNQFTYYNNSSIIQQQQQQSPTTAFNNNIQGACTSTPSANYNLLSNNQLVNLDFIIESNDTINIKNKRVASENIEDPKSENKKIKKRRAVVIERLDANTVSNFYILCKYKNFI